MSPDERLIGGNRQAHSNTGPGKTRAQVIEELHQFHRDGSAEKLQQQHFVGA